MTIMQRVFAMIPATPHDVSIAELDVHIVDLQPTTIRTALRALILRGYVEAFNSKTGRRFRRIEGAGEPKDARGGKRPGSGRKRANAAAA